MQILKLAPDQDGYQLREPADRLLQVRNSGGQLRTRLDQAESWKETTVNWTTNEHRYLYLTSFFETATQGGVNSFLLELITDDPRPSLHECQFLKGSTGLGATKGSTYQFVGRLAVRPLKVDHELNRIRINRFESNFNADLFNIDIEPILALESIFDQYYIEGETYNVDLSSMFSNSDNLDTTYTVDQLPAGLTLDSETGIISGVMGDPVTDFLNFPIEVTVTYRLGQTTNLINGVLRTNTTIGIAGHPVITGMEIGATFEVR